MSSPPSRGQWRLQKIYQFESKHRSWMYARHSSREERLTKKGSLHERETRNSRRCHHLSGKYQGFRKILVQSHWRNLSSATFGYYTHGKIANYISTPDFRHFFEKHHSSTQYIPHIIIVYMFNVFSMFVSTAKNREYIQCHRIKNLINY